MNALTTPAFIQSRLKAPRHTSVKAARWNGMGNEQGGTHWEMKVRILGDLPGSTQIRSDTDRLFHQSRSAAPHLRNEGLL